ncbi:MAG TPA: alkaline shock response membrane anchor protein AmaP [Jiangellaceae bacterium]
MTSRRTRRGNRLGLALTAFTLLAAAGYTLLRGTGRLPGHSPTEPVVPPTLRDVAQTEPWFWPTVAAVAAVLALLALRWLLVQLRSDRIPELVLADDEQGRTAIASAAFASALAAHAAALPSVTRTRAAVVAGRPDPRLRITIVAHPDADLAQLLERTTGEVLADARAAADPAALPTHMQIRIGRRGRRRPSRVL